MKTHDDKLDFLKKHLINYNEKETYFNLNTNFQPVDYYRILGTLFKMNYLTYEADGYIGVIRVGCSEE